MHYRPNYGIANFVKPSSEYLSTQVKRNTCAWFIVENITRFLNKFHMYCCTVLPPNRLFQMNERNECFDSVCIRTLATKPEYCPPQACFNVKRHRCLFLTTYMHAFGRDWTLNGRYHGYPHHTHQCSR